jgi:hypothetical protein
MSEPRNKPTLTRSLSLRARDWWTKIILSASFRNVPRTTEPVLKDFSAGCPSGLVLQTGRSGTKPKPRIRPGGCTPGPGRSSRFPSAAGPLQSSPAGKRERLRACASLTITGEALKHSCLGQTELFSSHFITSTIPINEIVRAQIIFRHARIIPS